MEKLRVNFVKSVIGVNITTIILAAIAYVTIVGFSWGEDSLFKTLVIGFLYVFISVAFSILVPKTFALKYDNKRFYMLRFGKEEVFEFANVLYIDEPYTIKHKALTFYTNKGNLKFISLDRDNKILDVFKSHCKNLISREEFQIRFPTIKL